ncbi:hypothetical protein [Alterisphingorhabdus coralli]|uniref:Uncharacterized protein n=1 Tax=Alterisphingorhabdus coralli TaxID=3071408 RepID=A0AA97FBS8_9SPHN|nr:hypothetical protein [Parasphingorhabdus sp. SCSIO 66989]WOE76752.1 hypothetical protein RB602_15310 [Parasphingorhabdus sp. SCSIO 66989]
MDDKVLLGVLRELFKGLTEKLEQLEQSNRELEKRVIAENRRTRDYLLTIADLSGQIHAGVKPSSAIPDHILQSPVMSAFLDNYPAEIPAPTEFARIDALRADIAMIADDTLRELRDAYVEGLKSQNQIQVAADRHGLELVQSELAQRGIEAEAQEHEKTAPDNMPEPSSEDQRVTNDPHKDDEARRVRDLASEPDYAADKSHDR